MHVTKYEFYNLKMLFLDNGKISAGPRLYMLPGLSNPVFLLVEEKLESEKKQDQGIKNEFSEE